MASSVSDRYYEDAGIDIQSYAAAQNQARLLGPVFVNNALAQPGAAAAGAGGGGAAGGVGAGMVLVIRAGLIAVFCSWLGALGLCIAALVRNVDCEKSIHIWLGLNALSNLLLFCRRCDGANGCGAFWNDWRFHTFFSIGWVVTTFCAILVYQVPFQSEERHCPDWIFLPAFVVATIQFSFIFTLCCICCVVTIGICARDSPAAANIKDIRAYLRSESNDTAPAQALKRAIRTMEIDAVDAKINIHTQAEVPLGNDAKMSFGNDPKTSFGNEPTVKDEKLVPNFRQLRELPLVRSICEIDPNIMWRREILPCVDNVNDVCDLVVSYLRETIWVISTTLDQHLSVAQFNPYNGLLMELHLGFRPRARFNPIVRILPRNGLILVIGGIALSSDGLLRICHRVDSFDINARKWDSYDDIDRRWPTLETDPIVPITNQHVIGESFSRSIPWSVEPMVDALVIHGDNIDTEALLILGPNRAVGGGYAQPNHRFARLLMAKVRGLMDLRDIPEQPSLRSTLVVHPERPDTIFAIGGPERDLSSLVVPPIEAPFNSVWEKLPQMKFGRSWPSVCCAKGCLVVVGGQVSHMDDAVGEVGLPVARVERFDLETQKWSELPKLPCMIVPSSNFKNGYHVEDLLPPPPVPPVPPAPPAPPAPPLEDLLPPVIPLPLATVEQLPPHTLLIADEKQDVMGNNPLPAAIDGPKPDSKETLGNHPTSTIDAKHNSKSPDTKDELGNNNPDEHAKDNGTHYGTSNGASWDTALVPNAIVPRVVCHYDSIIHFPPFGFYLDLASPLQLHEWEWQRTPYTLTRQPFQRILHSALLPQ